MPPLSLAPPAPAAPGRDLSFAPPGGTAPRGEISAARLLPPVSAAPTAADARLLAARDQPVGPPPAFKVSVLQHILETNSRLHGQIGDPATTAPEHGNDPPPSQAGGGSPFTLASVTLGGTDVDLKL